jgi:60 kDa SS-A/Ro ribonucleoprotein
MSYLKRHGTTPVPQSEPLRPDQVEDSAGGYVWAVDRWARLRRFLILGSEGGSYYAGERKLTLENIDALRECVMENPARVVVEATVISEKGRAPKNDQAIFALAYVVAHGDEEGKQLALDAMPRVCRTGTHLFQFVDLLKAWGHLTGRAKRRALERWYTGKDPDALAYQLVKYRERGGWTHRDLLRHFRPDHRPIFEWVAQGTLSSELPKMIEGFERAQRQGIGAEMTAKLVREYGLPREALNTDYLTEPVVWEALLEQGMPMTALIRNLGNMTRVGLLTPTSKATLTVVTQLSDDERLRKARVHPLAVLIALRTYASGRGFRGRGEWSPVPKIVDALDSAFYAAFGNVQPTGKRTLFGLDVSGSMSAGAIAGSNLTPREGAAAMALVTASVEDRYECMAFSQGLTPFPISARERLDDVVARTMRMPFSGTDCALPILYATKAEREVDTFLVYTDSETWAGSVHPAQALAEYRRKSGIDARLVVVGMVSNGFSIADPNDAGMLDCVGFDTATPELISAFARGEI